MTLKSKLFILAFIIVIVGLFYVFFVEDILINYPESILENRDSKNILEIAKDYVHSSSNAIITRNNISTGMFTDADYKNYYCTIKIPKEDALYREAWQDNEAKVVFESYLQGTTEWVVNNKYKISVYYYKNNNKNIVLLYEKTWVGLNKRVSAEINLPSECQNTDVYIKYESILAAFLGFSNGNDLRFHDNYLSVR